MLEMDKFDALQISIASPEKIRSWSYGEVKKPETINYRTHKPERDGLFCERIFGPQKDWECFCGKYKSIRYKGIVCERCNVEITKSSVRRERMGHIQLVTPVAHIWFSKGSPNYIALLLDISARELEKVLYFQSYIVIDPGNLPLSKKQLLPEEGTAGEMGYRELREKYGDMFTAKMGAEAIKELLAEIDLPKLEKELTEQLKTAPATKKAQLIKRLDLVKMFSRSISRPEWMIMDVVPVIPPDLRPMVQLDGGRFATSDLNDLYRRVINRNNRLKRLIKLQAPDIIIKNEKRMLQEAVNALIDNGRRGKNVTGPNNRPLKSLTDMLKGKQGRFRQNLLGKRVDYSGRSVIVVGPELKLNQAGIPKKMALELFKPFVMQRLQAKGLAANIKSAKKMIEREKDEVWDVLEEVIRNHPILLNRAPTLHRLGIQAFEPVLIEGKAIRIHPMVCTAYNADFDGDQMAVHVPLMLDAQVEARLLMMASNNILKPADGNPVAFPTQDMTIGLFYLTIMTPENDSYPRTTITLGKNETWENWLLPEGRPTDFVLAEDASDTLHKGFVFDGPEAIKALKKDKVESVTVYKPQVFASIEEARNAYETGNFELSAPIYMKRNLFLQPGKSEEANLSGNPYFKTTIGRVIFNDNLPADFPYQNAQVKKGNVSAIIKQLYNKYDLHLVGKTLDRLKSLGFKYATRSGLTISIVDMIDPPKKGEILEQADRKVQKIRERWANGELTRDERKQAEIDVWTKTTEDVTDDLLQEFEHTAKYGDYNPVYMMAFSGARGNMQQIRQLAAMRGLMSNPRGDILTFPIKSNFREGLNQSEYFISTYGARKGLVDTALRTADSGYLTRRLVDVAQDVVIIEPDCGTENGVEIAPVRQNRTSSNIMIDDIMVPIRYRVEGKLLAKPILHPLTKKPLVIEVGGENITLNAGLYCDNDISAEIENSCEFTIPMDKIEIGMINAEQIIDPRTNRLILRPDREFNEYVIDKMKELNFIEAKVRSKIVMRSPLTCRCRTGICQACYGSDLATGRKVDIGEAVGIIAAQSIGEPGTQLTMRTFHLGGVALAQRSYIKARTTGIAKFDMLRLAKISDRAKFEIGSGQETFDKTEFGSTIKTVVVGGHLVVENKSGRKDRVHIPVGAEMRVEPGAKVTPGKALAEYNPNNIITGYTGEVIFDDIELKDGMVVSDNGTIKILTQDFDPVTKDFIIEDYKIPQGAVLRVEDNEIIHAGNLLAEIYAESHAAIARMDGVTKFENLRIKNNQVISDNGMVFVFPTDDKEGERAEYPLPKSVKVAKDASPATTGLILNVRNGDIVYPNQKLFSVVSEENGVIQLSSHDTKISVTKEVKEEYEFKGEMAAAIDEKNKTLSLIAPISGVVKVISEKSAANKTQDRKRVIVKNETEYDVPRGVILRPKKNCKIPNGGEVAENGELTSKLFIQAEIDGVVEITSIKSEHRVRLISDDLSILNGATLARAAIDRETEDIIADAGTVIDEPLHELLATNAGAIREVYILKGEQEAVNVVGEDGMKLQYPVPEEAEICVEDGQLVKAGDKLVSDIDPMISEIAGKVNYIYGYNKIICEEIIEKVLVYSGVEFSYPAALKLKFPPTVLQNTELTMAPIPFEAYEQVEDTDGTPGILIKQRVLKAKKYAITKEMAADGSLLVKDGDTVKEGQMLAILKSKNKGVVLLEHDATKTGKLKSTIKNIIVQPGESHQILDGAELRISEGDMVKKGEILAKWGTAARKTTDIVQGLPRVAELFEVRKPKKEAVIAEESGVVHVTGTNVTILDPNSGSEKAVRVQYGSAGLVVHDGEYIEAGDPITDGQIFSKKLVKVVALPTVRRYLNDEIQRVYRDQGVSINDKHIEIIVRQMLRKVTIVHPGDSDFTLNDSIHVRRFEDKCSRLSAKGKRIPVGVPMIQGITKASLTTDSFISAAAFQETTRVLTKAAIRSKIDYLRGLKENLVIGKLVPAGTGLAANRNIEYANLPIEVERVEDTPEELFKSMVEGEDRDLKALEEELFMTPPTPLSSSAEDIEDEGDFDDEDE
ncbi:MAG: DNA-directed RNA polymerase subunit beta' [Candidatus Riflebacteria bacterium]|nr:DNA-directed RNA polymerase subunit beta' [Candidatus Riflebacteria bacterium]